MNDNDIDKLNFTDYAWEALYDVVDDENFRDHDAGLIYK